MNIENNLKYKIENNFSMKLKMLIILLVLFLSIHISLAADSFNVTIISEKHDLVDHEVIIQVKNLDVINKDFNLRFIIENTSFDLSSLQDVYIYEYKPILKEFPIYSTELVSQTCYDLNEFGKNISYDCSYHRNYQSGVEYKYQVDWKPAKMQLVKNSDKVSTDYGSITISKASSKCKYDDFNNSYDCDGTKLFKITWKTPIKRNENGWGSKGYYAIEDAITGVNYDPWWDASWLYRKPITINNNQNPNTLTNYQVAINLMYSGNMQPDFDDIRFTWYNSTSNREELIPYWIENKSDSEWAYVWVKVPYIQGGSYTTIHVYYGNSGASSLSNIYNTFRVIDGNQPLKGNWHFDEGIGNTTYDSSGNGNDGILYNGTTWVDGKFGKALSFDGVDDYVYAGNSQSLNMTKSNAFTIISWVKAYPKTNFPDGYDNMEITGNNDYWIFTIKKNGGLRLDLKDITMNWHQPGTSTVKVSTGSWTFAATSWNGTHAKFYNGTSTQVINYGSFIVGHSGNGQFIGRNGVNSGVYNYTFNGTIDEVRIFNRTLSDEEILDLYKGYGFTIADYPGSLIVRSYTSPEPTYYMGEATYIYDYNDLDKYIPVLLVILLMAVVIQLVSSFKRWL